MVHTMTVTTHIQPEVGLLSACVPAFVIGMLTNVHPRVPVKHLGHWQNAQGRQHLSGSN